MLRLNNINELLEMKIEIPNGLRARFFDHVRGFHE